MAQACCRRHTNGCKPIKAACSFNCACRPRLGPYFSSRTLQRLHHSGAVAVCKLPAELQKKEGWRGDGEAPVQGCGVLLHGEQREVDLQPTACGQRHNAGAGTHTGRTKLMRGVLMPLLCASLAKAELAMPRSSVHSAHSTCEH